MQEGAINISFKAGIVLTATVSFQIINSAAWSCLISWHHLHVHLHECSRSTVFMF